MIYSFPKLLYVLSLLFLVMFISAVLGVFLFRATETGKIISSSTMMNFKNLGQAFITLFRCSTGEDWHIIMFDLMKDESNGTYFTTYR